MYQISNKTLTFYFISNRIFRDEMITIERIWFEIESPIRKSLQLDIAIIIGVLVSKCPSSSLQVDCLFKCILLHCLSGKQLLKSNWLCERPSLFYKRHMLDLECRQSHWLNFWAVTWDKKDSSLIWNLGIDFINLNSLFHSGRFPVHFIRS